MRGLVGRHSPLCKVSNSSNGRVEDLGIQVKEHVHASSFVHDCEVGVGCSKLKDAGQELLESHCKAFSAG